MHAGEAGANEVAELTQSDSGYEAGEEGPVQAGPEGTTPHSPTSEQQFSAILSTHSHYPSSSGAYSQPQVTQPQPQHADYSNSAAESAAAPEAEPADLRRQADTCTMSHT